MIDLCITHHKTEGLLEKLLKELYEDTFTLNKNCKVYLYDSGSGDKFKNWIKKNITKYTIEKVYFKENNGYAYACNYMASKGNSEIIGFIHGDVIISPKDLAKVNSIFSENPGIHILGPKVITEDGKIDSAGTFGSNFSPEFRGLHQFDKNKNLYTDRKKCINVSGCAYFIRRNVWDVLSNHPKYRRLYPSALGAFLETPHFFEEVWCSYFARFLGYNVIYDGSITVKHSVRASSSLPVESKNSIENTAYEISQKIFLYTCDKVGIPL